MRAAGWLACVWRAGSGFMCERGALCAAGMGWGMCFVCSRNELDDVCYVQQE